jgi:penicillin-binding protein 1C
VGIWVGRGDAGTMNQLSGARSAARLAHAILTDLHGSIPGDLADAGFPPPPGRVPVELCLLGGRRSDGLCGPTLTEWVRPDEMPPVAEPAAIRRGPDGDRLELIVPAIHRAWARAEGYPLASGPGEGPVRLAVQTPEHNSRIWRNPDAPSIANRLALKASVEPRVEQVVWYVDGEAFAVTDPDHPVFWPMRAGTHRFQVRLPSGEEASRPVRVVVE